MLKPPVLILISAIFFIMLTSLKTYLAWMSLLLWSLGVTFYCVIQSKLWLSFLIFFAFISGLAVLFLFFMSLSTKPYVLGFVIPVPLLLVLASVKEKIKVGDDSLFVLSMGGMYYSVISLLLIIALMTMKTLLGDSSSTFRSTSN